MGGCTEHASDKQGNSCLCSTGSLSMLAQHTYRKARPLLQETFSFQVFYKIHISAHYFYSFQGVRAERYIQLLIQMVFPFLNSREQNPNNYTENPSLLISFSSPRDVPCSVLGKATQQQTPIFVGRRLSPSGTCAILAPLGTALGDNVINIISVTAIYHIPPGIYNLCLRNSKEIKAHFLPVSGVS